MSRQHLTPSRTALEHDEPKARLKLILRDQLPDDHPIKRKLKRVQVGHVRGDYATLILREFNSEMAQDLTENVESWYIDPRSSDYDGVRIKVEVGEAP